MQAITVKFLPATNTKPSRWKALAQGGSIIVSSDYSGKDQQLAALALCKKLDWEGDLLEGWTHEGHAVFVFVASDRIENAHNHSKRVVPFVRIGAAS